MNRVSDQSPLKQGEMIKEYQINSVLGRGGFGITYLATDTRLKHKVAIKEYFPLTAWREKQTRNVISHCSNGEADHFLIGLQRFEKEGTVLASFDHPNIVRVLRLIPENSTAYLVMPYIEGQTLEDYLKDREHGLSFPEIKDIYMPIMDGLRAVHEVNLLHLDIAPDNIFLRKKGSPFLIDFGGARHQVGLSSTQASFLIAKDSYAPPEQYSGVNLHPQADIYALAACIYHSITGITPPTAQDRSQALVNHEKDPLLSLEGLIKTSEFPHSFTQEIENALSLSIKDRVASVKEFQDLLFTRKEKISRRTEKPIWKIGIIVAVFVAALIAVLFLQIKEPSDDFHHSSPTQNPASIPIHRPKRTTVDPECTLGLKSREECP